MQRFVSRVMMCGMLLALGAGPLRAGLVSLDSGFGSANADRLALNEFADLSFGLSLPGASATTTSLPDGTLATTAADLFEQNGSTTFQFDFDHHRSGAFGEGANASSFIQMFFTASENALYTASGFYQLTTGTNAVSYRAILTDQTNGAGLFDSLQTSDQTPGEQFVLGGAGGDLDPLNGVNYFTGSLHGELIAGHQYVLETSAAIQTFNYTDNYNVGDAGASANGALTLVIDPNLQPPPQPPVGTPEPASMALFGMGALGLIALRRRRGSLAA